MDGQVDGGGVGFNGEDLLDFSDRQGEIDDGGLAHHEIDAGFPLRGKTRLVGRNLISTDGDGRGGIAAGLVGDELSLRAGLAVFDGNGSPGQGGTGVISYRPG